MSQWYFHKDGKEVGPISAKQLVELAGQGSMQLTTLVRRSDMAQSMPAKEVKELRAAIASHTPDRASDPPKPSTDSTPTDTATSTSRNKLRTALSIAICVSLALPFSVLFLTLLWTREHADSRFMSVVAIIIGLLSVIPSVVVARIGFAAKTLRKQLVTALIICGSSSMIVIAAILVSPAVPNAIGWLLCLAYLVLTGVLLARIWNIEHQYRLNALSRFALIFIPTAIALSVFLLPSDNVSQVSKSLHMPTVLWGPEASGMIQLQLPASAMSVQGNSATTKLSDEEKAMVPTIIVQGTRVFAEAQSQGYGSREEASLLRLSALLPMVQLINGETAEQLKQCAQDAFGENPSVEMLKFEAEYWASAAWCVNAMSDRNMKKRLAKVLWSRQPNLALIQSKETRQILAAKYGQASMWLGDEQRLDMLIQKVNGKKGDILRADEPYGREFVKALLLSGNNDRVQPWVDAQPVSMSLILIQRGDVEAAAKIIGSHPMEDLMQAWLLMQCAFDVACRGTVSPNPYFGDLRKLIDEMADNNAVVGDAMGLTLEVFVAAEQRSFDDALSAATQINSESVSRQFREPVRLLQRDSLIVTAICAMKNNRADDASLLLGQLPVQDGTMSISLLRQAIKQGMDPIEVIRQVTGIDTSRARRSNSRGTDFGRVIELLRTSGINLKDMEWINSNLDWDRMDIWEFWDSIKFGFISPETVWILSRNELVHPKIWSVGIAKDELQAEVASFFAAAIIGRSGIPLSADYLDADTNMTAFPYGKFPKERPIETSSGSE